MAVVAPRPCPVLSQLPAGPAVLVWGSQRCWGSNPCRAELGCPCCQVLLSLPGSAPAAPAAQARECSPSSHILQLSSVEKKKKQNNFSPCICCSLAVLKDFYPDLHLDGTVAARRVGLDFLEGKVELGAGVAVPPAPARVPQDPPSCSMNSLELAQRSCQDPLLLSLPHSLAPSPSSGPNLLGFPGKGALPWDVWRT